jgi:glycosyltransferase involved in cell wall biosynthesis
MKDYSLILPTHNHPTLVKRLLDSIVNTTSSLDRLEVILYLDSDDLQSQNISHPAIDIIKVIKQPDTMGNMIRAGYAASQAKYIMLLNDDMLFHTKEWDAKVLEVFSRFDDEPAMVYGNDLYYGKMICTFPILTRTACELMEKICPAEYRLHCIDAHIFDIFKRLEGMGYKRAVYLRNVIFEHMHHELAAINDSETGPKSDTDDQSLYFSFAQHRQQVALKMAELIKDRKGQLCKP